MLTPNALTALRALGLEQRAVADGFESTSQVVRSWRSGRLIFRNSYDQYRAEIRGRQCHDPSRRYAEVAGRVCARECVATGDALHRSQIRTTRRRRSLCRWERVRGGRRGGGGWDPLRRTNEPVRSGKATFHRIDVLARLGGHGTAAAGFIPPEQTAWWGPHGHVVHYYVRRGELLNWVAHIETDSWTEESWSTPGRHARTARDLPTLERAAQADV